MLYVLVSISFPMIYVLEVVHKECEANLYFLGDELIHPASIKRVVLEGAGL